MKVRYSSNNSGGDWWLNDADWHKLEKAGWKVDWFAESRKSSVWKANEDGRWLGALASDATKEFDRIEDAVVEFERLTNQCADDEGCNCCGQPHRFYEAYE